MTKGELWRSSTLYSMQDGNIMLRDEKKAEVLNAFASVFISNANCSQGTQPAELEDRGNNPR